MPDNIWLKTYTYPVDDYHPHYPDVEKDYWPRLMRLAAILAENGTSILGCCPWRTLGEQRQTFG